MLTQNRLKEVLKYDNESGLFTWISVKHGAKVGDFAGHAEYSGYIRIGVDGKMYRAHQLAFLYEEGYFPENEIDHINRVRNDNRWANLREASRQCQLRNSAERSDNTTGVKGLRWNKANKRWDARITVGGKQYHIGCFEDKLDAAYHRYAAEQCLGFQDCDIYSSALKYIKENQ